MATEVGPGSATTDTRPAAPAVVRWGAWAGIAYVLPWLIGLFLAPSAPDPFGSAVTINAFTFTGTRPHNIYLRHAAAVTAALGEIASPAGTNRPRQETPRL